MTSSLGSTGCFPWHALRPMESKDQAWSSSDGVRSRRRRPSEFTRQSLQELSTTEWCLLFIFVLRIVHTMAHQFPREKNEAPTATTRGLLETINS